MNGNRFVRLALSLLLTGAMLGSLGLAHASESTPAAVPDSFQTSAWLTHRGNAARTGFTDDSGPMNVPERVWGVSTGNSIFDPPLVFNGLVLAAHGVGSLMALDLDTGSQAWYVSPSDAGPRSTTISDDGVVVLKDQGGQLSAVDALTGTSIWAVERLGLNDPGPVVDGVLYSAGTDETLHAVDVHTGESLWEIVLPTGIDTNTTSHDYPGYPGPRPAAVDEGILTTGDDEGNVIAVDLATQDILWTAPCGLNEGDPATPDNLSSFVVDTPAMADGTVYVACNGMNTYPGPGTYEIYDLTIGVLVALDARTGVELWRFQTEANSGLRSPTIGPDGVYTVGTDGLVYALSPQTGEIQWQFDTGSPVVAPTALGRDLLYVSSSDGSIFAIWASDGSEQWRLEHQAISTAGPVIVGGYLLIATDGGQVIAYREPGE